MVPGDYGRRAQVRGIWAFAAPRELTATAVVARTRTNAEEARAWRLESSFLLPCLLPANAVAHNDRPEIGEDYYLTSQFEPNVSVSDRRCFRQSTIGVTGQNFRFELLTKNVTKNGFDVVLRTWYDSRIYAAKASYIAFIQ